MATLQLENVTSRGDNSSLPVHVDELMILSVLNHKKAVLLAPVIVYTVILLTLGVFGNPIAIYIYGWRWPHTTTKYFLFCLAIFDLVNCLITMPTEIALMLNFFHFNNNVICKISRFTTYTMNNSSVFVLLVIAIDRYIRICKPHNQPISIYGSRITCCVAIIIGIAVSWPALFLYGNVTIPIPIPGGPLIHGVMCNVETRFSQTPYPLAYFLYLCIAFTLIAIVMSLLYILIGREIIKRKRLKKLRTSSTSSHTKKKRSDKASTFSNDSSAPSPSPIVTPRNLHPLPTSPLVDPAVQSPVSPVSPGDQGATSLIRGRLPTLSFSRLSKRKWRPGKSTLMLFAITVVYILSFLPFLIIGMIRLVTGSSFYPSLTQAEEVAVNVFLRSYLVNNCANPLVYGLCNSKFRKEFINLLKMCFKKHSGDE